MGADRIGEIGDMTSGQDAEVYGAGFTAGSLARKGARGDTFEKFSSDSILVVCSNTFTLFRLGKTSVTVKIFLISFHVFVCAFPPEISSIFGKSFPFPFSYFVFYQE